MNRQELVNKMAKQAKITVKDAEKALGAFMSVVKETVENGEAVQLVGFGTFERRERAAREARNPIGGGTVSVPAKKVPAFKPGKAFKDAVNQ